MDRPGELQCSCFVIKGQRSHKLGLCSVVISCESSAVTGSSGLVCCLEAPSTSPLTSLTQFSPLDLIRKKHSELSVSILSFSKP